MNFKERLSQDAVLLRNIYIKKPFPKANVAIIELYLNSGVAFGVGATSRAKSPSPKPLAQSEGGQFEPTVDSYSGRIMDTDAEYKALSAIADTLESLYNYSVQGKIYLYTERQPCESCLEILDQFKRKFPNLQIEVFWDYPYPS
jgi:filamentous hemagglutinin